MQELNPAPGDGRKELPDFLIDQPRYLKSHPAIQVTIDNIEELAHSLYGTYFPDFKRYYKSDSEPQPAFVFINYGEKTRRVVFIGYWLVIEDGLVNSYHPNLFKRMFKEV